MPSHIASSPIWGTSRRLDPLSPGASRPHLGHLTPGQAVPTRGLTREAPGVPQGGGPRGYCATHMRRDGFYKGTHVKPMRGGPRPTRTHTLKR